MGDANQEVEVEGFLGATILQENHCVSHVLSVLYNMVVQACKYSKIPALTDLQTL